MTTLDRYIARQYLFNVVALLVVLFSFVVAVDVALNIDKFIEGAMKTDPKAEGVRRAALTVLAIVHLWGPRLLQLYVYLVGLVLVAAMGFTFTQLVRNRELVAVLAGGISLRRLARPVLMVAALMLGLKVLNQELVLSRPEIAPLLTRGNDDVGRIDWKQVPVMLACDTQGAIWLASTFDPARGEMANVTVWLRDKGVATGAISAERAVWRDGGWDLTNPRLASMQLAPGGAGSAPGGGARPTPSRIMTDLDPESLKFRQFRAYSQSLSWAQIGEMLARPNVDSKFRAELQRIRWGRASQLLSSFLALIITMPFFLMREPKNMLVQSLKCAPIGIVSLMGGILLTSVNWPMLPPGVAVFIPVLILVPVAIAVVSSMKS